MEPQIDADAHRFNRKSKFINHKSEDVAQPPPAGGASATAPAMARPFVAVPGSGTRQSLHVILAKPVLAQTGAGIGAPVFSNCPLGPLPHADRYVDYTRRMDRNGSMVERL